MENSAQVALVHCENYQEDSVRQSVQKGLVLLGGAARFASPGETILVKPNLLIGDNPEKCVNPHPLVFQAVLEQFIATGAKITFGDSPAFGSPRAAARGSGLLQVAEKLGVPLADFETPVTLSFPDGHLIKQFTLAKSVADADGLISLSKLKSHALTRLTGAIKNQFGCIPSVLKSEFHTRMPNVEKFSEMLVDLSLLIKPRLYIMDGIIGMEGNGPRNGTPRPMHVLLFSTDPVALDAAVCRMVNLDEALVGPIVFGNANGLGNSHNITFLGDPLDRFSTPDFVVNRARSSTTSSGKKSPMTSFMHKHVTPRPYILADACTRCGNCVKICPAQPKALSWANGEDNPPVYNYEYCIRCYCCQETCPHQAISVKVPLLGKFVRR